MNLYLTLSYNSNFPGNNFSNFTTLIDGPSIILDGNYECALIAINYPIDWEYNYGDILITKKTYQDDKSKYSFKEIETKDLDLSNLKISETKTTIFNITTFDRLTAEEFYRTLYMLISTDENTQDLFQYYSISQLQSLNYRLNIFDLRALDVNFNGGLTKYISRSKSLVKYDEIYNKKTFNIPSIFEITKYIHVLIDIIKDQQSFNKTLQFLKSVRIKGNHGDVIYEEFKNPQYFDINKTLINKIGIKLVDENFDLINFTSGSVDLKIHIRKKKK